MLKNYDCTIHYHLGKKNVVANALSRRESATLSAMQTTQELLLKEFFRMSMDFSNKCCTESLIYALSLQSTLKERIGDAQKGDQFLERMRMQVEKESIKVLIMNTDRTLMFENRVYVPNDGELRNE